MSRAESKDSSLVLLSPKAVGDINRAKVITSLYDHGPQSRADLARLMNSTRSTISTIVQPLITAKIIEELPVSSGKGTKSTTGKPAIPLWFSGKAPNLIGIHIVPQGIIIVQTSLTGTIIKKVEFDLTKVDNPRKETIRILQVELPKFVKGIPKVLGIGVSVGGTVNTKSGTINNVARAPFLNGLAIKSLISKKLDLEIFVNHHPRAQAMGDRWFGSGRSRSDFISIIISDAIGIGIYLNGVLHSGKNGTGGEYGHTQFLTTKNAPLCNCGMRGCFESYASFDKFKSNLDRLGIARSNNEIPFLIEKSKNYPDLLKALKEYAEIIGTGIANLENTLAVGLFLVHGEVTSLGEEFLEMISKAADKYLIEKTDKGLEIEFVKGPDHFAVLGAASLVLAIKLQFPL